MVAVSERRAPNRLRQQGIHLGLFKIPISALAVFLNGVARISAPGHMAGERMPMNRANDRMVASLWLRVAHLIGDRVPDGRGTADYRRPDPELMRSIARPPCLLANGSKSARVSR